MIVDSVAGHRRTREALAAFLKSPSQSIELETRQNFWLEPERPLLKTFRMVKSDGLILTKELPGNVLQVSGRRDLLEGYIGHFEFADEDDGKHRHPEHRDDTAWGTESIIIEVENEVDDPAPA